MKLFNKYALSALLLAQAVFAGQLSAARTYNIISQGGKANVYENGILKQSVIQWRFYDMVIDASGSLKLVKVRYGIDENGRAVDSNAAFFNTEVITTGNFAVIRNICNKSTYSITTSLRDRGQGQNFNQTFGSGCSGFNKIVPWDQDNNFFTITVG